MTGNAICVNCKYKIARAFTILQEYKIYIISRVLIANSRIFRAVVMDKTQRESEERLVVILPVSLSATSRYSLVSCISGERHIVARDNVTHK